MPIYPSSRVLPYVYVITHKETGQFYIGYRCNNKVPSSADLGIKYFTSSKKIKAIGFSSFNFIIVAEFFSKEAAFDFETSLISESITHPLNLNKHCLTPGQKRFVNGAHTNETKEKIRLSATGRRHWTNGIANKNSKTCPGPGWYIGECKSDENFTRRQKSTQGKRWWTNGVINMRGEKCPGAEWSSGQTSTVERMAVLKRRTGGKFWNNGSVNMISKDVLSAPWVLGKIK